MIESINRFQLQKALVKLFCFLGSKKRTFHVNAFEELNARLRSAIQKITCPVDSSSPAVPLVLQG